MIEHNHPTRAQLIENFQHLDRLFRQGIAIYANRTANLGQGIDLVCYGGDRAGDHIHFAAECSKILLEKRGQFALQFSGSVNPFAKTVKVVMR